MSTPTTKDSPGVAGADEAIGDEPTDAQVGADELPRPTVLARILLLPIYTYRVLIAPLLPPSCRFWPSCSTYAVEAMTRHGGLRGTYLTVRRLLRCHPWHAGGVDIVPERFSFRFQRPDSSELE